MTETINRETEMRDRKAEWPKTEDALLEEIRKNLEGPHGYGSCVYAMSLSAVAAFNYIAHKLGVTGFQASCADMDIIRRTRSMKGGFIILKAEDLLYPQYDLRGKLEEFIGEQETWLRVEAKKKLAEADGFSTNPNVLAHWKRLAGEP